MVITQHTAVDSLCFTATIKRSRISDQECFIALDEQLERFAALHRMSNQECFTTTNKSVSQLQSRMNIQKNCIVEMGDFSTIGTCVLHINILDNSVLTCAGGLNHQY